MSIKKLYIFISWILEHFLNNEALVISCNCWWLLGYLLIYISEKCFPNLKNESHKFKTSADHIKYKTSLVSFLQFPNGILKFKSLCEIGSRNIRSRTWGVRQLMSDVWKQLLFPSKNGCRSSCPTYLASRYSVRNGIAHTLLWGQQPATSALTSLAWKFSSLIIFLFLVPAWRHLLLIMSSCSKTLASSPGHCTENICIFGGSGRF